jgi:serine phosphatase RsbU (regulator of sigma subunit)
MYWGWTNQFNLIGFIGLPLMFIPLIYLHVIAHYGLLDLSIKVRRNVQYIVVSSVWIILLMAIFVTIVMYLSNLEIVIPKVEVRSAFIEVMDESLPPDESNQVSRVMLMLLLVGATVMVWKGGKQGQRWINRKFHRSKYDYRQSASELAEIISNNINMYDLSRGMVLKIASLMHLKRAGVLFFKDEKVCCSQAIYGFQSQKWEDFCLKSEEEIITSLQKFHGEISVDYLPPIVKENLRNHGFLYIIPIRSKEKLLGAILVGEKLSEATYHKEDLDFLAALAKQASVAIENAFLYEELTDKERLKHELNIARQIQMASLPQSTPQIKGLDIAGFSLPAFEVGGDYYDYLNGSDNELTVIVGDVSGKGTSAALYMSKIQGILRSLHTFDLSPRELFIRANDVLYQDIEKKSFVTAIGGAFNAQARKLIVARAGHLPLFHYKSDKKCIEQVIPHGIGLGLENSGKFAEEINEIEISFNNKDVFLFATDGITESFSDSGEEFGEANLEKILKKYADEDAQSILNKCIAGIKEFSGNSNQHDDITIVVVKIL